MLAASHPAVSNPAAEHASAPAPMDTDSGGTAADDCSPAHGGSSGDNELLMTAATVDSAGGNGEEASGGGGEAAYALPEAVDCAALPPPSTPVTAGLTTPAPQPQPMGEPQTADSEAAADGPSQPVAASEAAAAAPEANEPAVAAPFDADTPPADLQQPVMGPAVEEHVLSVAETPDVAAAFARGDRKKLLRMLLDLPLGPSPREVIFTTLTAQNA